MHGVDVRVRGKARAIISSLPEVLDEQVTFGILLVEAVDPNLLRVYRVGDGGAVVVIRVDVEVAPEERAVPGGELCKGLIFTVLLCVGNSLPYESDHLLFCRVRRG